MSDIKLTDFSIGELDPVITLVEKRMAELSEKIDQAEKWYKKSEVFKDLHNIYTDEMMVMGLWRVQLIQAKGEVSQRETMQSN